MSSQQSGSATSPSADLFATHLAQSTQSAKLAQPKTPAKQPTPPKAPRSAPKSAKPKTSNPSGANSSEGDDSASTSQESSAAAGSAANGTSKSRTGSARGNTAKTNAARRTDTQTSASTTEPSADTSNDSGLNLLQLLARSAVKGEDSSSIAKDGTASQAPASDSKDDNSSTADPNALALAMLSQAFAVGFTGAAAAAATHNQAADSASADAGAGIAGVTNGAVADGTLPAGTTTDGTTTDGTRSEGTSGQQLGALLAQDLAAAAKAKGAADPAQTDPAATGSSSHNTASAGAMPEGTTAPDGTLPNADAIAQSVAQLGAASHFARDNNIAELKAPVGSPAWTQELAGHLTFMSHRGLESGSLRVSPEHLGPVEVQITVQNGDASVWFGANHPDTRAALEQALPKLREMFANQGLTLSDSGVSREPPRNQTRSAAPQSMAVAAIGSADVSVTSATRVSLGLIDTYA